MFLNQKEEKKKIKNKRKTITKHHATKIKNHVTSYVNVSHACNKTNQTRREEDTKPESFTVPGTDRFVRDKMVFPH